MVIRSGSRPVGPDLAAREDPGGKATIRVVVSGKGMETTLTFKGDMVVVTQDLEHPGKKPVFTVPEKAENPRITACHPRSSPW